MTRILNSSSYGLLGHKMFQILTQHFDTYVTFRHFDQRIKGTSIFDENRIIDKIDAFDFGSIESAIKKIEPKYIINCIGIIKQIQRNLNPKVAIYINSLFPHLLAETIKNSDTKLIQISTVVFYRAKLGTIQRMILQMQMTYMGGLNI